MSKRSRSPTLQPGAYQKYRALFDSRRVDLGPDGSPEQHGRVVRTDDHGEWRTVPGFDSGKLLVSSLGYAMIWRLRGGWGKPTLGPILQHTDGSWVHRIKVGYISYYVHRLICRAFHGPEPYLCTVDHIDNDTSNNSAENIQWLSGSGQALNRRTARPKAQGQPIWIRKMDDPYGEWQWFHNSTEAAKRHGLNASNIRLVARGQRNNTGGFVAKYAEALESQADLEAGDDSNFEVHGFEKPLSNPSQDKERWVMAPDTDKIRVSTRGRIQHKKRGEQWTLRYTPTPGAGHTYAAVYYKGELKYVHNLVYLAHVGNIPAGHTMDHLISTRKFDNRLCNLRPATLPQQRANQIRQSNGSMSNSLKTPVLAQAPGTTTWEWFGSTRDASQTLHSRFPQLSFDSGGICRAANSEGLKSVHRWKFKKA